MTSLFGIFAGVAAVLAIVLTALFVGVCLIVRWATDAARVGPHRGAAGEDEPWAEMPPPAAGRHASGIPVGFRRGNR